MANSGTKSWIVAGGLVATAFIGIVCASVAGTYIELYTWADLGRTLFVVLGLVGLLWLRRIAFRSNASFAVVTRTIAFLLAVLAGTYLVVAVLFRGFDHHPIQLLEWRSRENLRQIGKAMQQYSDDNGGWFPFDQRGPLHSLALLYPKYVGDPKTFDNSFFARSLNFRRLGERFPQGTGLAGSLCRYGYTWRIRRDALSGFVIAGDLPPLFAKWGGDVLCVDGSVRCWINEPFCSSDPHDNIFAPELGWSADTDSWIRQE